MKVNTAGARVQVEGLPPRVVIEHEETLGAVREAFAAFEVAAEEHARLRAVADRAEREAFAASTRADRLDRRAEARAAVTAEREEERRAYAAANRAGRALIETMRENQAEVDAVAARMTLRAHGEIVDALCVADEAVGRRVGPKVGRHPMLSPHDPHGSISEAASRRKDLERCDLANTPRLAEIAGDRCGLVGVVGRKMGTTGGPLILTTPRRARMLVKESGPGGVHGWVWEYER